MGRGRVGVTHLCSRNETSATGTDYVPIMCSIWRRGGQDKSQCGYLNIRPSACLDKQDLHVGISAWALGRFCEKVGVDEGERRGALGVATMGTGFSLSGQTRLSLTQSHLCAIAFRPRIVQAAKLIFKCNEIRGDATWRAAFIKSPSVFLFSTQL